MRKTQRLGLLLTEREKAWVINLARLEGGLTQAALIRRLINKAGKEHGLCLDLYQFKQGTGNLPHVEDENRNNHLIGIDEKDSKEIER